MAKFQVCEIDTMDGERKYKSTIFENESDARSFANTMNEKAEFAGVGDYVIYRVVTSPGHRFVEAR